MGLTIADALQFGGLQDAAVVAGGDRLSNAIESISVLEVAESRIARWVIKNQLYITSFYAIKEDVEMQKVVIRSLASCGCCGLVICHIDLWIQEMDPEVVSLCNELHFPLIIAKPECSYVDILNPIIQHLMKEKEEGQSAYSYANIRNDFLDLIINEEDIDQVFHKISAKIGLEVSYYDIYCDVIYSSKALFEVEAEQSYIKEHFNDTINECNKQQHLACQLLGKNKLICLIRSQRSLFGFIVVDNPPGINGESLLETLAPLCTSCTLLFSRGNKITDIRDKYLQEYLGDLLVWNFRSDEVAIRRGREVGLDITNKNSILLVNLNSLQQTENSIQVKEMSDYVKQRVLPGISQQAAHYDANSQVVYRSDTVIVFLNNSHHTLDLRQLGQDIVENFLTDGVLSVSVGYGPAFENIRDIPTAYNQSFQAAVLGRDYYGENKVVAYPDVWFFHKLRSMQEDKQTLEMCHKLFEPLVQYDELHQTELVHTLVMLLKENGDAGQLAQKMYLHRNTLLHRKNKICEIYGYSPFEMPYLLNFLVALGIME